MSTEKEDSLNWFYVKAIENKTARYIEDGRKYAF